MPWPFFSVLKPTFISRARSFSLSADRLLRKGNKKSGNENSDIGETSTGSGFDFKQGLGVFADSAAAPTFIFSNDDYDTSIEFLNGEVLAFKSYYPPGYDSSITPSEVDLCATTKCSTTNGRGFVTGQGVEGGDLLIFDLGWEFSDTVLFECPRLFQTPSAELLGCEADNPIECQKITCTNSDAFEDFCFEGFDFIVDDSDMASPGNSLGVDTNSPSSPGAWIRIRVAIYCANTEVEFLESIHSPVEEEEEEEGGKSKKKSKKSSN